MQALPSINNNEKKEANDVAKSDSPTKDQNNASGNDGDDGSPAPRPSPHFPIPPGNLPYVNVWRGDAGGGGAPGRPPPQLWLYKCFGTTSVDDARFDDGNGRPVCDGIETRVRASMAMTARLVPALPHDRRSLRRYRRVSRDSMAADCRNEFVDPAERARALSPLFDVVTRKNDDDHDDEKTKTKENDRRSDFSYACYGRTHYAVIETDFADEHEHDHEHDRKDSVLIGAPNCTLGVTVKEHSDGRTHQLRLGPLIVDMTDEYDTDERDEERERNRSENRDTVARRSPNETRRDYERRRSERRERQRRRARRGDEDDAASQTNDDDRRRRRPDASNDDDDTETARNVLNPWSTALTSEEAARVLGYVRRVAGKTWDTFWMLTTAVKDNVKDDFPSRVQESSQRILRQLGKSGDRCRSAAGKLYRFFLDDDDEDDEDNVGGGDGYA